MVATIIQFPSIKDLTNKKKQYSNLKKVLLNLTLAKLSEMELPFYGKSSIPGNVIQEAQAISLRFLGTKDLKTNSLPLLEQEIKIVKNKILKLK